MAKNQKYLVFGIVAFVVFLAVAQGPLMRLLGIPGGIDIFVKDANGLPISGVVCYVNPGGKSTCSDPLLLDRNMEMVCQLKTFSNSAGRCSFPTVPTGTPDNPTTWYHPWGVSCTSQTAIIQQGSKEVLPGRTSNVWVTLTGCTGTTPPSTTTTLPNCKTHDTSKCYNGDVWWYDSCNQRQERKQSCGTFGCSNGVCVAAPASTSTTIATTTSTTTTSTTTTIKPGCIDVCTNAGCYVNAEGQGFRCLTQSNGCKAWVMDSTCNESNQLMLLLAVGALLAGIVMVFFYFTRRK